MSPSIRLATPDDAPAVRAIYAPIVAQTCISFETDVPSEAEMRRRIAVTLPMRPWLVRELAGRVQGYAYAGAYRARAAYQWSTEVSVYVGEEARRCGAARALYTALFSVLHLQGYHMAYAGIALPNAASLRFHEALGFVPVGVYREAGYKHGAWHDVSWWQRPLGPTPTRPVPPRALSEARQLPGWAAALAPPAAMNQGCHPLARILAPSRLPPMAN